MTGAMDAPSWTLTGHQHNYALTFAVHDEEKLLAAARVAAAWTVIALIVFVVLVGRDVPTLATLLGGLAAYLGIRYRSKNGNGK